MPNADTNITDNIIFRAQDSRLKQINQAYFVSARTAPRDDIAVLTA